MDAKLIGNRLRELRGDRTLAEMGEAVGISEAAYSNYEQGIRIPRDVTKKRIADYFNLTIDEIFF
jgi:putative transcriptional regulator